MAPADIVVSVDPGVSGGVAFLDLTSWASPILLSVHSMPVVKSTSRKGKVTRRPDAAALAALVRSGNPGRAVVELVASRPGEGHVNSFTFGKGCGIIEGVLAALGLPVVEVMPAVWKPAIRCPADKDKARARASELFPEHRGRWSRGMDDGRAEAALIGYWLARHGGGSVRPAIGRGQGPIEW